MKILLYSDVHWTTNSSIVRQRGEKFSKRLENLIASVNWAEQLADKEGCGAIICLGDFFDKPTLQAEELTALMEVNWAKMPHYFIIGNHEAEGADLRYSSIYSLPKSFTFIDEPVKFNFGNRDVLMLPYGAEDKDIVNSSIILSHNDLKGIRYGKIISQSGLDTQKLYNNCELCICGHIHNRTQVNDKISIIGNLTGQNFSEDAFIYEHGVVILDTDTLKCSFYKNPFAFNFYKIDVANGKSPAIEGNAVVSVTALESQFEAVKYALKDYIYKIIIKKEEAQEQVEFQQVDHLQKFRECVLDKVGASDIILEELENVCK